MSSTNKGGGSAEMGEASDAVAHIPDFILKRTFEYVPATCCLDVAVPEFYIRMPIFCSKERSFPSLPCESSRGQMSWSAYENFLRQLSGCWDLRKILLVITPVEWPSRDPDAHILHCYCLNGREYRAATTLSRKVTYLIERNYRPDTYRIVKCSRPIDLVDAANNTPITRQIFDMIGEASKAVRTRYKGRAVRLTYLGNGTTGKVVDPASPKFSGIRSLQQPKIPVRMQCRLASWMKKTSMDSKPKSKAGA